jgi:hypothetical protein
MGIVFIAVVSNDLEHRWERSESLQWQGKTPSEIVLSHTSLALQTRGEPLNFRDGFPLDNRRAPGEAW